MAWLDDHLHRYRLLEAERCDVPLDVLLGVGRFDPDRAELGGTTRLGSATMPGCDHSEHSDHDGRFESWSFETDRPLSMDALRKVAAKLPADVYRAKGIFDAAEAPGHRGVLQVVGKRVDIAFDGEWGDQQPRTQIVAIGARGALGHGDLERHFASCLPGACDSPVERVLP